MDGHLWLVGMMGSGKTRVGRGLANTLGARFVDVDELIADRVGCTIAQFWGARGEAAFRDMEAAAIIQISDASPAVIATGGGAVLRESNVAAMRRSGRVVWLTAAASTLAERVGSGNGRPLLAQGASADDVAGILADRADRYAWAADVAIDTDDADLLEVIDRIEVWWNAST